MMGNSKSSMELLQQRQYKSFDDYYVDRKQCRKHRPCENNNESILNEYTKSYDDYYVNNDCKDKLIELKRGRSLINSRTKTRSANNRVSCNQSQQQQQLPPNFKRINSLPPLSRLQRKQNQQSAPIDYHQHQRINEQKYIQKGFDMIRHHFGQNDCEMSPRLTELETLLLLLNEKLNDIEMNRQLCMEKLLQLKLDLQQKYANQQQTFQSMMNQSKFPTQNVSIEQNLGNILRIDFIENYLKRIENLFNIEQEPFLIMHSAQQQQYNQLNIPKCDNQNSDPDSIHPLNSTNLSINRNQLTTNEKCNQIKLYYEYLLKTVMPQLYGHQYFDNNNCNNNNNDSYNNHQNINNEFDRKFQKFRNILMKLRLEVQSISIQNEQQLIYARRAFIQEIDSYLNTLDQMIQQQHQQQHQQQLNDPN